MLSAQESKLVQIINSDDLIYEINGGQETQRLIGHVVIAHDGTTFYCDSARYDVSNNTFQAYQHVRAEMPQNVNLTCNRMDYDGNTKVADAMGNAKVADGKVVLTSEKLTFYRAENYGKYLTGGKLVNAENTLTSQQGYYYPNKEMAYFKKNVKLVNKDYTLTTDTLGYDTRNETAIFMAYTHIKSEDGEFDTQKGTYETRTKKMNLESRTKVINKDYMLEADFTDYDDSTKIATMVGNVFMRQLDSSITVYSDSAYYNRTTQKGNMQGNVVMIQKDSSSILTAKQGKFDKKNETGMAWNDVVIRKKDKSYTIWADTTSFDNKNNTGRAWGHLFMIQKDSSYRMWANEATFDNKAETGNAQGNVFICNKDSSYMVWSKKANFDNKNDSGMAWDEVLIKQKDSSYTIWADTTTFNNKNNTGTADGKVKIIDKDTTLSIWGGHALFFREINETYMTRNPISLQKFDKDTLYVLADTLYAREDTLKRRTFKAYHHVRMYMKDLQAIADSMVYAYSDSVIMLYKKPTLWSDSSQLSGDTIKIYMRNKKIDSLAVIGNCFLVAAQDTIGFNQIKGRQFRCKFRDNKLIRLHVVGNSESIYYIKDEKKGYQGMNKSTSQEMFVFLENNQAQKIIFKSKPQGEYFPIHEVLFKEQKLEGMEWKYENKPEKPALPAAEPMKTGI